MGGMELASMAVMVGYMSCRQDSKLSGRGHRRENTHTKGSNLWYVTVADGPEETTRRWQLLAKT